MNIIITEQQEQLFASLALQEELMMHDYRNKRLLIQKFLDDNFMRGSEPALKGGYPSTNEYVIMKINGKPCKVMTDKQLFYLLQDKFKNIVNSSELDDFLKETMIAWYKRQINKNGNVMNT